MDISKFDIADYLDSNEMIAEYLNVVLEEGDDSEIVVAIGNIAKAIGMTKIAEETVSYTHLDVYKRQVLTKFVKEIDENDATLFEAIPGEIIGWTSTDKGNQTQTETFKIKNGTLTKINTTVSESDLKKIDKFAPKNSHFELNNGLYDDTKYPSCLLYTSRCV